MIKQQKNVQNHNSTNKYKIVSVRCKYGHYSQQLKITESQCRHNQHHKIEMDPKEQSIYKKRKYLNKFTEVERIMTCS